MPKKRSNPGAATVETGLEFLRAAAAASPHGLMVEEAGRIAYANAAYARLVGSASPADITGRRVSGVTVPEVDVSSGSGPEWLGVRLPFGDGRRHLALHVVRDVSETRRLERRLRESEKMEALGRLVGGVAHDFNNVLTAITLYSDLLRDRFGPEAHEIEEIREAAQRGADMVRQLLTFARQQPSSPCTVSLRQIISGMSAVLEPLIGEDIELTTHFRAAADWVRADPSQLQQVVLNLTMNARDAMPEGGRIRIETASLDLDPHSASRYPGLQPGPFVSLCVSDTGCGMDEQVRAHMFEPFFTTKKSGAGTGLGLAMVYGIVTQGGGAITVHSKPGKGTRVTVLLPQTPHRESEGAADVSETAVARGAETVLLAEDDPAVRASMAELLSGAGYGVLEARDGAHAVRLARSHGGPIHLVLSDIVMPRLNGIEAARQIRQIHPEAQALFVSGYPAKAHAAAAEKAVLYKPFTRAVLARKVRETLDGRPASRGRRPQAAKGTL
jgi:two-component system cell cycle sensor histidine kinase/response regulator CckA